MFLFFSNPATGTSIFCGILTHLGEVIGSKHIFPNSDSCIWVFWVFGLVLCLLERSRTPLPDFISFTTCPESTYLTIFKPYICHGYPGDSSWYHLHTSWHLNVCEAFTASCLHFTYYTDSKARCIEESAEVMTFFTL